MLGIFISLWIIVRILVHILSEMKPYETITQIRKQTQTYTSTHYNRKMVKLKVNKQLLYECVALDPLIYLYIVCNYRVIIFTISIIFLELDLDFTVQYYIVTVALHPYFAN